MGSAAVLPGGLARRLELLAHGAGLVVRPALQAQLEVLDGGGGVPGSVERRTEVVGRVGARQLRGVPALGHGLAEVRDRARVVAAPEAREALVVERRRAAGGGGALRRARRGGGGGGRRGGGRRCRCRFGRRRRR